MERLVKFLVGGSFVMLGLGCEKLNHESFSNNSSSGVCESKTFVQRQGINGKLDILLVVDTSGSMSAELNSLGKRFNVFMSTLQKRFPALDYRIATLLAHSEFKAGILWSPDECDSEPVLSGNGSMDFDRDVKPHLSCMLDNFKKDTANHSGEAAFSSVLKAVGPNLAQIRSQGFFRPDAGLSVLFVADENEVCHVPPGYDEDRQEEENFRESGQCNGKTPLAVFNALTEIQGGLPMTIAAIVDLKKNSEDYGWGYVGEESDLGYKGIVELAGANGIKTEIHGTNTEVTNDLIEIGAKASENLSRLTRFAVSAYASSISSVTVNNVEVPFTSAKAGEVEISLDDAGSAGDEININYCF